MAKVPETRASLILRLPSTKDAEAWREFVSIYEPFVYRFAVRGGLQDADARELVQNVMLAVARAIGRWQPDRGRFRAWLFRIARNQLIDSLRKLPRVPSAHGGTTMMSLFQQQPMQDEWIKEELVRSQRQELFRWAADRVRSSVKEGTWRAFWLTAVDDQPVEDVAMELGITVGAVYIARSRVLAKLREVVKGWEDQDHAL